MKNRERIEQLESRVSRLEAGTVAPPRPWQVGDVVRLDEPNQLCCREFIGVEATITEVRDNGHIWYTSPKGDSWWPPDHLTLIRPAAAPVDDAAELRAEVARLVSERDAALAERNAIRARIMVCKQVYRVGNGAWHEFPLDNYTHTARLIDIAPIAPDERKGERRTGRQVSVGSYGKRRHDSDRRRTPGTRADRGGEV